MASIWDSAGYFDRALARRLVSMGATRCTRFHRGVRRSRIWILVCVLTVSQPLWARGVYQKPADFLAEAFADQVPDPRLLWVTKPVRAGAEEILGHALGKLRIRYWGDTRQTVWILDEVGKEEPITVGLVVERDALKKVKVLEFRETRGWEVRHPFFTDQFEGATLTPDHELSEPIDGISGATLSVRALRKLARLALFLHQQTKLSHAPQ